MLQAVRYQHQVLASVVTSCLLQQLLQLVCVPHHCTLLITQAQHSHIQYVLAAFLCPTACISAAYYSMCQLCTAQYCCTYSYNSFTLASQHSYCFGIQACMCETLVVRVGKRMLQARLRAAHHQSTTTRYNSSRTCGGMHLITNTATGQAPGSY